mgnify:CR=1 FL=1
MLEGFLAFSLFTTTQPGILTIGVPARTTTGGSIGIACGGVCIQIRVSDILISLTTTPVIPGDLILIVPVLIVGRIGNPLPMPGILLIGSIYYLNGTCCL